MTNDSNQERYALTNASKSRPSKILGLGLVSAASAVAGGLAVAWWYRKTLAKLQNPIAIGDVLKLESPQTDAEVLSSTEPEAAGRKS